MESDFPLIEKIFRYKKKNLTLPDEESSVDLRDRKIRFLTERKMKVKDRHEKLNERSMDNKQRKKEKIFKNKNSSTESIA